MLPFRIARITVSRILGSNSALTFRSSPSLRYSQVLKRTRLPSNSGERDTGDVVDFLPYTLPVLEYVFIFIKCTDAHSVQVNILRPWDVFELFKKTSSIEFWAYLFSQMLERWFGVTNSGFEPSCVYGICLQKFMIYIALQRIFSPEASNHELLEKDLTEAMQETRGLFCGHIEAHSTLWIIKPTTGFALVKSNQVHLHISGSAWLL